MIEAEQLVPMKYNGSTNFIFDTVKLYFKDKWVHDIYENLKSGYCEMSQINLTLAEMGMEQDLFDLKVYEARLLGREIL